jgi:hypothetical protein
MKTNQSARNFRSRSNRKTNNKNNAGHQAMKALRSNTIRVGGPIDPEPIANDVVVTKTFQTLVPFGTTVQSVSPAILAVAFPGYSATAPTFNRFRLIKVSAYGTEQPATMPGSVTIAFPIGTAGYNDGATFTDYGTYGARRPCLHLSPTFNLRNIWLISTDALSVLFTVLTGGGDVILQYTVEIRSLPN